MNNYDLFWTVFAAIGQAVGAIATSAAVIVTLWQIRYANRKKVKVRFSDKNVVISENGNLKFHFVNLTVTNIGNRNVIVPDMTNPIVKAIQKQLPCTLEPEESLDLVFDIKLFLRNLREQLKNGTFKEKDKLTLYMLDSAGKEYCIRSDQTIKKYIEDNQKYG